MLTRLEEEMMRGLGEGCLQARNRCSKEMSEASLSSVILAGAIGAAVVVWHGRRLRVDVAVIANSRRRGRAQAG